jgi:hypothetical protein
VGPRSTSDMTMPWLSTPEAVTLLSCTKSIKIYDCNVIKLVNWWEDNSPLLFISQWFTSFSMPLLAYQCWSRQTSKGQKNLQSRQQASGIKASKYNEQTGNYHTTNLSEIHMIPTCFRKFTIGFQVPSFIWSIF